MITISLCMIVKDEEATLDQCLSSISDLVDEIIVVDTGSTDSTKSIAKKYTNKIYDFVWIDDFSAARNYSFSKAECDYCMWLDADDVLLDAERIKFKALKEALTPDIDTVIMKYDVGTAMQQHTCCSFCRERIVKRSNHFLWIDPVHEYLLFQGTYLNADVTITHKKQKPATTRNLDIFEKYLRNGNALSERNWFYYAKELAQNGQFDQAITYYQKYLTTSDGLICTYMDACIELASIYHHLQDEKNELKALLQYFEHDAPRPEILCKIAYFYKMKDEIDIAKIYFELATHIPKPKSNWGFILADYWDYIPFMELCACCYYSGDIDGAISYNQLAAEHYPNDAKVLHNQTSLAKVKSSLEAMHGD